MMSNRHGSKSKQSAAATASPPEPMSMKQWTVGAIDSLISRSDEYDVMRGDVQVHRPSLLSILLLCTQTCNNNIIYIVIATPADR
mmetsp:Transcript_19086/g.38419  ORF Transcript_19086/g.38419 Transcript_19086/m.38419 type:complete len:85 (-) Transcript_19086:548-802(-)